MTEIALKVDGMSCRHCVMRIKKALDSLKGVISADVAIGLVKVKFDASVIRKEDIGKAIENSGYKVTGG
ncbi:MAG: cation transporter [Nitrospirota bacterium]